MKAIRRRSPAKDFIKTRERDGDIKARLVPADKERPKLQKSLCKG